MFLNGEIVKIPSEIPVIVLVTILHRRRRSDFVFNIRLFIQIKRFVESYIGFYGKP